MWQYFFGFRDDRTAQVARAFLDASNSLIRWRLVQAPRSSFRMTYFDNEDLDLTEAGLELCCTSQNGGIEKIEFRKRYRDELGWSHCVSLESLVVEQDSETAICSETIVQAATRILGPGAVAKKMRQVLDLLIERTEIVLYADSGPVATLILDGITHRRPTAGTFVDMGFELELFSTSKEFEEYYELEEYFLSVFNVIPLDGTRSQRMRRTMKAEKAPMPRKVILDADPGADDSLAIMLAMNSPELDVVGLTITHGNIGAAQGARNCAATFNVLRKWVQNRYQELPSIAVNASEKTILPDVVENLMGSDGFSGMSGKYSDPSIPIEVDAGALFSRIMESNEPGTVSLVVTGPLTNLAEWTRDRPELVARLDEIICMGGAVFDPGNVGAFSEFNLSRDPAAARAVIDFCRCPPISGIRPPGSPIPLTFVGLDVTHRIQLSQADLAFLRQRVVDDGLVTFVEDVTSSYKEFYWRFYRIRGICLHDVVAVACIIDPSLGSYQQFHLEVEDTGRFTSGMVVADIRPSEVLVDSSKEETAVCYRFDEARFRREYLGRIFGLDTASCLFC